MVPSDVLFVVGYAPTESYETAVQKNFWVSVSKAVDAVRSGEHTVVAIDVNAAMGRREGVRAPSDGCISPRRVGTCVLRPPWASVDDSLRDSPHARM